MLDKLKLNNLVITNKKLILKARVQTISKLVQKLKKAKTKSDTVKDKDRTRKYMECISELKTQKPVDLMRQVLAQSGGNTKSVLTNGRSTPKELSFAMLEENKIMSQLLESFRQELKLDNDKEKVEWREEVLEMSKRRAKLERTEEKKRKRKELKEIKANDRKRLEWLQENQLSPDGEHATENQLDQKHQLNNIELNDSDKSGKTSNPQKATKPKEKPKAIKPGTQSNSTTAQKATKLTDKLNLKTDKSDIQSINPIKQTSTTLKEKTTKKPAKQRPTHVIDPFFITESGQPYLSTAIDNTDDEDDEEEKLRRQPGAQTSADKGWRKPKHETTFERPPQTQRGSKKIKFNDQGELAITTPAPTLKSTPTPSISTEGMHPSWVAKQKWKPKIAEFQGTKITFDD